MSTVSLIWTRPGLSRAAAAVCLLLLICGANGCATRPPRRAGAPAPAPAAEIRALWVDAFHAGIRTPQEAEQLVADAKSANFNTLIVQVRRRGDALYTKSFEPPLDDPAYDPTFDALANIIEVAHREGLEVHAWLNAMPVWRDATPPKDERHVFNQHGPSKSGEEHWLTLSPKGEDHFPVGYFLDPGHPGAAAHVADVYVNIVRNYKVDGIHFDYIRYPETEERFPRGSGVGYNATALARFRAATGRSDIPEPGDEQWMAWRRQQVTNLVRRVYLESKAINPRIKVSAAVIAWGKPPAEEKNFLDASPGQRIFQNWNEWLKGGILDLAVPMNYAREADPTVRGWFNGWIAYEKKHKHGRQLAVGIGAYLNTPKFTLAQISRVRQPEGKDHADGVSFFSYYSLTAAPPSAANSQNAPASTPPSAPPAPLSSAERLAFFTGGLPASEATGPAEPAAFPQRAPIPKMDWIERPATGWIAGTVKGADGKGQDNVTVQMKRAGSWFARTRRAQADGNGYFGFTNLKPGAYRVRVERQGIRKELRVEVKAGEVARAELAF